MRISAGTVTFGVVAILLGLVAMFVAKRVLEGKPDAPAAVVQGVPIVVPRVNIPAGTRITMRDLQSARVSQETAPAGAVRAPAIAANRYAKTTLQAGQPVLESSLWAIGEGPSLADQLEPGYRALTINVSGVSAGAEFLRSGSLVDIALTVQQSLDDLEHGIGTVTLLENVKLLTGLDSASSRRDGLGAGTATVTVAATPEEANKLILAQRYGVLSVILRNTADVAITEDGRTMIEPRSILNLPPRPAPVKPYTVEQWIGGRRQIVELSPDRVQEAEDATAADTQRRNDLTSLLQSSPASQPVEGLRTHGVSTPVDRPANPSGNDLRSSSNDRLRGTLRRSPVPQVTQSPSREQAPRRETITLHATPSPVAAPAADRVTFGKPVVEQLSSKPSRVQRLESQPILSAPRRFVVSTKPAPVQPVAEPVETLRTNAMAGESAADLEVKQEEKNSPAKLRPAPATSAHLGSPKQENVSTSDSLQSRTLEQLYPHGGGLSNTRQPTDNTGAEFRSTSTGLRSVKSSVQTLRSAQRTR